MQFKQVLLVFSALMALAYSFPTGAEQNITINFAQNASKISNFLDDNKPLMVIVEDKNPNSDSIVMEFVYRSNDGNSISESNGTDKDKYVVDSSLYKETHDQTKNLNEKDKEKLTEEINTEKTVNLPKSDSSYTIKNFGKETVTSLMPEEVSPLSGKWPKYFYDVFNPVKPFPELQPEKFNKINKQVQSENVDAFMPYYEKERKEPINVAGPQLSPLSIYEREFNVPIFD